jgi:hypothetical protein
MACSPACPKLNTVRAAHGMAKQVQSPDAASQLLHIALQTDVLGYLALSWPAKLGVMAPADSIVGYASADGSANVSAYGIAVRRRQRLLASPPQPPAAAPIETALP